MSENSGMAAETSLPRTPSASSISSIVKNHTIPDASTTASDPTTSDSHSITGKRSLGSLTKSPSKSAEDDEANALYGLGMPPRKRGGVGVLGRGPPIAPVKPVAITEVITPARRNAKQSLL